MSDFDRARNAELGSIWARRHYESLMFWRRTRLWGGIAVLLVFLAYCASLSS